MLPQLATGVTVRRARPGDAAPVLALLAQISVRPDERRYDETFAQVVRHPEAVVFVATNGVRVVGYLAMSHRPQIHLGARVAVVDEFVIDNARDDDGIGHALLHAAITQARGLGCCRVDLQTTHASQSGRFYEGIGFVEVESNLVRLQPIPAAKR